MYFRGTNHKKNFESAMQPYKFESLSRVYLSALYLLTADNGLWSKAKHHSKPNTIDFESIRIGGGSVESYVLFKTAQDLCCGTNRITVSEIADKEIISDKLFTVICTAMMISRHGKNILNLGGQKLCQYKKQSTTHHL